jgi:hypothetical protein
VLALLTFGCDDSPTPLNGDLAVSPDQAAPPSATVLATTQTLTNCIAVDANSVYWTEASSTNIPDAGALGRLMKVAKSGGTPMLLADAIDTPGCAVIDDVNAYVTQGSTILAVPLAGGAAMPLALNQHVLPGSTPRLAAHGGQVYWITDVYGPVDAFNGMNALVSVDRSGGSVSVLFNDVTGSPGGIAVDASNIYYSDLNGMYLRPLAGGAAMRIDVGSLHNNRFAVDDMHILVAEIAGIGMGDIAAFKLDGSGRTILSNSLATALALDANFAYGNLMGKLTRFSFDGTSTMTLLDDSAPRAIALDADDLYFTDGSSILRLAK